MGLRPKFGPKRRNLKHPFPFFSRIHARGLLMAHSTHFPLIFNRVNVVSVLKIGHLNLNLKTISTYLDSKYTCMNMHRGKNNCFSFFPLGLVLSSRSTSYEIVLLRRRSFSQCTYCCFQTIDSKGVFNLSTFNYTFCLHKTEIVSLISLGPTVLYINSLLS